MSCCRLVKYFEWHNKGGTCWGCVHRDAFAMQIHTCSMRRKKPFELEQNPSASATLKPLIENLGQQYFLYFFPMIAQGKFMSCAPDKSSEEDGPLRAFSASSDEPIILDDAVEDVNLACVNGRSCKGTALLPLHMFRMGLFMCEKRFSNKDPDQEKHDEDKSSCRLTDRTASLHPECFERCMCLACAVHSLVSLPLALLVQNIRTVIRFFVAGSDQFFLHQLCFLPAQAEEQRLQALSSLHRKVSSTHGDVICFCTGSLSCFLQVHQDVHQLHCMHDEEAG